MSSLILRAVRNTLPVCLALLAFRGAGAEDTVSIDIYTARVPPYVTSNREGVPVGSLVPVVDSFIAERGLQARITVLPWSAAFRRTISNPRSLLYPVDRIAAREDQFHWVRPLVTTHYYLYGLKDKVDPKATLEEIVADGALISCTQNSIQCELLRKNGVPEAHILKIEGASIGRRLRLIVAERNYYTVYDPAVFAYLTKSQNLPSDELVQLQKLGEMTSYLAASKDMPPELLERLK